MNPYTVPLVVAAALASAGTILAVVIALKALLKGPQ